MFRVIGLAGIALAFGLSLTMLYLRWSPSAGQFGGWDKLGSGSRQAASLFISPAPYASSGVRPARAEWGRRAL